MKCFSHSDLDATATCQGCGKGLCAQCAGRFDATLCEGCLLGHNRAVAIEMYKGLAITIVIMVAGLWFMISNNTQGMSISGYVFSALLPAFTYWGWKFISENQALSFIGNINFWLFYFMFKLIFAYIIGIFVGPYQIYKMISELRTTSQTKRQIARGEI